MEDDRAIPDGTVARMVRAIGPEWELLEATPAERGHSPVYRVGVETGDGVREYVLKASPRADGASTGAGDGSTDGDPPSTDGVATEARLLAVLAEHTAIPVPTVVGAVDDRADLPTPFFLAASMPGEALSFGETGQLGDAVLRRVARRTGAHLGELHALAAVDSFGRVGHDRAGRLDGDPPSDDVGGLAVADGTDSWPEVLRRSVERELDGLDGTRFSDLAPRLRPRFGERVDALEGPFAPVLGRIDHGVHNLLLDPDCGDVAAVLDWGFTLAVPAGYDLQCVEYVLSGAVLSTLPSVPDRRPLVRTALLDGYRSRTGYRSVDGRRSRTGHGSAAGHRSAADHRTAPGFRPEVVGRNHALYELLSVVRAMNHLDAGVAKVSAGREPAVAARLREAAEATLRGDGG